MGQGEGGRYVNIALMDKILTINSDFQNRKESGKEAAKNERHRKREVERKK